MAAMKTARGTKLLFKIGDGASPENFTALCTINTQRGIAFSAAMTEQAVPDCASPDLPAWIQRFKDTLSAAVNGAGVLNTPDIDIMFAFLKDPNSRNCQFVVDVPGADGGRVFEGFFHCNEFNVTGERGPNSEATLAFASDGEISIANNT